MAFRALKAFRAFKASRAPNISKSITLAISNDR